MPKTKNNTKRRASTKTNGRSFSKKYVAAFIFLFAAVGSFVLYQSFAASPSAGLTHANLDTSQTGPNVRVITENSSASKKNTKVVELTPGTGAAVFNSTTVNLSPGIYQACLNAYVPSGSASGSLSLASYTAGVSGVPSSVAYNLASSTDYSRTKCVSGVAFTSPSTDVQAIITNNGSGAIHIGAILITRTGNLPSGIKPLTPNTSWQWQLTGNIDTTILDGVNNTKKMYDIDLFDTSQSVISTLHAKNIYVVCYFSAGTSEDWRPDYSQFTTAVKGNNNGWPGEKWLDIRNTNVLMPIMKARMDLAVSKGCDGLEPDNVDGYTNRTGFPLTANDQLNYLTMLANEAHARRLSIGLKNDVEQVSQLSNTFDWALNEQCYQYNECGVYSAFISKNKAVFGVEYKGDPSTFCPKANAANYDWLQKGLNLNATPRTACRNG